MKIRIKLTLFFTLILFILLLALSFWYQYRLFYFLRQESIKNLERFTRSFFRPDRFKENPNTHNFRNELEEMENRDHFAKIINQYMWYTLYDENLDVIKQSPLAREFPIKNLTSYLNKKYFTLKIKSDSNYFKSNSIEMLPEFIFEQGFYTDKDNFTFHCIGKATTLYENDKKFYFVVLMTDNKNVDYLDKTLRNAIFSLSFLIVIIILLGLFYSKYSLNPINKIIHELNGISEKNLSQRIKLNINNKDEIAEISLSINNLLERIENAFNMEKQFISDVSHEFKTPISILQLNIDKISNNPKLTDEEIDTITSSLEILYSLDFMIEKLLYLSRLESNLCSFNSEMIPLNELLTSLKNNLDSIAEMKNIKLNLKLYDEKLTISGDRALLYIAFYNVIENALKYTDKGKVSVYAEERSNKTRIIVEDTGVGIPYNKIEKIFNKFYRADSSRHDSKSVGIGLTITKRILDIHGALIHVESKEGKGTKFIIEFKKNSSFS